MMISTSSQHIRQSRGYTLLFAVLVSSVVLSIGISILTISKKEFLLSASARDSTSAFYAADSGLECATYYNDYHDAFSATDPKVDDGTIVCSGYTPTTYGTIGDTASAETTVGKTYILQIPVGDKGACAIVSVRKYKDIDLDISVIPIPYTEILSRGYNVGWENDACGGASSRRVERALRLVQ